MNTRIVGGEEAQIGTWGWAASLQIRYDGLHFCGGTVIDERHIITAAHCFPWIHKQGFDPVDVVRVLIGAHDKSSPEPDNAQFFDLLSVRSHPQYDKDDQQSKFDIAILTLRQTIDFQGSPFISRVCLPSFNSTPVDLSNPEYPAVGTNLVAIGWGDQRSGSGQGSRTLRQVTIQAIDKDDITCQRWLEKDSMTQLCAAALEKDTCQGDSGGPLMQWRQDKKVWELIGITSYGLGCANILRAGIYTRVAAYLDWIRLNTPTAAPTLPTRSTVRTTKATTETRTTVLTGGQTQNPDNSGTKASRC
ncbi:unnamed protein product, partial [Rotaria sp. Silwood2]